MRLAGCLYMLTSTTTTCPFARMQSTIPSSMCCIVYGDEDGQQSSPLRLVSRIIPTPKQGRSGHILVRVKVAGLNPVDAKDIMGDKLPANWRIAKRWLRWYIRNNIPGFDFAGTVVENFSGFAVDDKVFGTTPPFVGTLAEYISVPVDQVCHMPSNYTFEQAAALPLVGLTALQILSSHITNNTSVLVLGGSGGTGHVAIQVANCLGAGSVVVVCSSKNESFCRSLGATEVIDYTAGNILDDLHKSSSKPFSVVMDCVTSADPRDQALDYPNRIQHSAGLLADDYIYRRLGGPSADWIRAGLERTAGLNFWKDKPEQLFWVRFPKSAGELQQLREWAEAGKLTPHISKSYDFTEADVRDAFHAILSRRIQGKVVVRIHSDDVETKDKSIQ